MKINRFGINLDEGLPLIESNLKKLYVPCFDSVFNKLKNWIKNDTEKTPLMFGGQIGSGKSTLIIKALLESSRQPEITLHFDQEGLNLDTGDFLSITLSGFIKEAIKLNINLSFSNLPSELFKLQANDWQGVIDILYPQDLLVESFKVKVTARKKFSNHSRYISEIINKIGDKIQKHTGLPLFIFASGIDKFDSSTTAFFALRDSIEILANFKTLFEVNAAHFFPPSEDIFKTETKLFIYVTTETNLVDILKKRMGVYADPINNELKLIAKWSGGNPRQAIRLLTHYQAVRKDIKSNKIKKIRDAIQRTGSDFFSYSSKPSMELIKTILKDCKLNTSLIILPGDKDTAKLALYGNWIFITDTFGNGDWPVIINPLVKSFFIDDKVITEEPEQKLLSQYAQQTGMSATALSFNMIKKNGEEKTGDEILSEFQSSGVEIPFHLKITEILNVISAALLSKDRADRIIIGFKDRKLLKAARSYLFAKANSYEYQRVQHAELIGGENCTPIYEFEKLLAVDSDIFSFEFSGEWTDKQLYSLDKYRDRLINQQIIWWIPQEDLKRYLPNWIQLRQLFELFLLEDELLSSLTIEDIKGDLDFFKDLVESKESAESMVVENLKIVLEYLKHNKGGENG